MLLGTRITENGSIFTTIKEVEGIYVLTNNLETFDEILGEPIIEELGKVALTEVELENLLKYIVTQIND